MTRSLFDDAPTPYTAPDVIAPGAVLLRGFACDVADLLAQGVGQVIAAAPLRHLVTQGGHTMSVAMSNCGDFGWVSDRTGYRYERADPLSGQPWPAMPGDFLALAVRAAAEAGFDGFSPDACLINRYAPGSRMSLHQDSDEADMTAPIVSVSLGLPAVFLFGGNQRSDRPARYRLAPGAVAVGRPIAAGLSRHRAAGRRRSPPARAAAHQPDLSPRGLTRACPHRRGSCRAR